MSGDQSKARFTGLTVAKTSSVKTKTQGESERLLRWAPSQLLVSPEYDAVFD